MADPNIKVSFGSLEELSGNIHGQVTAIENNLSSLRTQIDKLSTSWEGGASEGFQGVKAKWTTAADELHRTLVKIETAVKTSTDGYHDAEDRNRRRWDQ
jgi:WXG100 family type VII secretion target